MKATSLKEREEKKKRFLLVWNLHDRDRLGTLQHTPSTKLYVFTSRSKYKPAQPPSTLIYSWICLYDNLSLF